MFDFDNSIVGKRHWAPRIAYVDPPWQRAVGQKPQIESLIQRKNDQKRHFVVERGAELRSYMGILGAHLHGSSTTL
jgi:hypothetical protein